MFRSPFFALLACAVCLNACAASFAQVGAPPALPPVPRELGEAPSPPEASIRADIAAEVSAEVVQVRPPPDWRTTTLAIAPVEGGKSLETYLDQNVVGLALRRGVTGLLEPRSLRAVEVRRERAETRGNVREQVSWTGGIERLAFLGRVSSAGYLLHIRVLAADSVTREVAVKVEFDANAVTAYSAALGQFRQAQQAFRRSLNLATAGFVSQFEAAQAAYEADGGKYDGSTSGREAAAQVQRYAEWTAQRARLASRTAVGSDLPDATPAALRQHALRQHGGRETQPAKVTQWTIEARMLEVEKGETFWLDRVTAQGQDEADVVRRIVDRLLDDVLVQSKVP